MLNLLIFALILFSSLTVSAKYEHRQKIQNQRIEKNISSGKLNEAEAARLKKGQANIETKVQKFESTKEQAKSDGVVSQEEKQQLIRQRASVKRSQDRQLEKAKKNINDKK